MFSGSNNYTLWFWPWAIFFEFSVSFSTSQSLIKILCILRIALSGLKFIRCNPFASEWRLLLINIYVYIYWMIDERSNTDPNEHFHNEAAFYILKCREFLWTLHKNLFRQQPILRYRNRPGFYPAKYCYFEDLIVFGSVRKKNTLRSWIGET